MTVPRLLHLDGDRLHQSPAPELLELRRGETWQCGHITLGPESTLAVPGVVGSNFLDIEVGVSQSLLHSCLLLRHICPCVLVCVGTRGWVSMSGYLSTGGKKKITW